MLQKLKQRKRVDEGFTIIEVLIVLAIAGLILLIVFLAVPALERNARNTQRRSDVSAIASAVGDYIDNNGGTLPTTVAGDGSTTSNLVLGGTTGNTENAKLGYYTTGTSATQAASSGLVYIQNVTTATSPSVVATGSESVSAVSTQSVVIDTGENCNSTGTAAGSVSPRSAAIFYVTETGNGNGSRQCVEQ